MAARNAALCRRWETGSPVLSLALSHDGMRVASSSEDSLVRIWDARTGVLILGPLQGHRSWVRSVAWSHDDTKFVSGSDDSTIRAWDAQTGACIGEPFRGHTRKVMSVAFSHDSILIASGSSDNTIRMWDASTGAQKGQPLRGHFDVVWSVAFSYDSTHIVSGSSDKTIRIWDAHTGAPLGEPLRGHTWHIYSVAFSPDSTRIVSGSEDKTIRIWDARTGAPVGQPLTGHTSAVRSVDFSHDSSRIVSGSSDKTIRMWDVYTGALIDEALNGHANWVHSVAFLPNSNCVISGSQDRSICVWGVPHIAPSFDMVTSDMSAKEMFECLVKHGCTDLSSSIDPARYSTSAVASGGFGDVWQAWMENDVLVAVKCLRLHIILQGDLKGMKRTTRELHNWSKARHENIQELLGIVMFQGRLGMVSRWMHNGNLQQYIEKNPNVERYPLCVQMAKGVAYLHGIGMIHGDLKAINILVSTNGVVKISDFDYSIMSESTLRFSETSKSGGGTLRWMAPELLLYREDDDSPPVTHNAKTDIYALGMTMLEVISGNVPYYQYAFDVAIFHALSKKQPPKRPQELSGSDERSTHMWTIFLQCWDHDPSARPNASSVLASLQRLAF